MDAASGGPDDLRTLAHAVVDAWRDRRDDKPQRALALALNISEDGDVVTAAEAILAVDAQGYARAMGEVVEHLNSLSDAAVATYQEHRTDYADGFADGSVEAWQAVRKLAERD